MPNEANTEATVAKVIAKVWRPIVSTLLAVLIAVVGFIGSDMYSKTAEADSKFATKTELNQSKVECQKHNNDAIQRIEKNLESMRSEFNSNMRRLEDKVDEFLVETRCT